MNNITITQTMIQPQEVALYTALKISLALIKSSIINNFMIFLFIRNIIIMLLQKPQFNPISYPIHIASQISLITIEYNIYKYIQLAYTMLQLTTWLHNIVIVCMIVLLINLYIKVNISNHLDLTDILMYIFDLPFYMITTIPLTYVIKQLFAISLYINIFFVAIIIGCLIMTLVTLYKSILRPMYLHEYIYTHLLLKVYIFNLFFRAFMCLYVLLVVNGFLVSK